MFSVKTNCGFSAALRQVNSSIFGMLPMVQPGCCVSGYMACIGFTLHVFVVFASLLVFAFHVDPTLPCPFHHAVDVNLFYVPAMIGRLTKLTTVVIHSISRLSYAVVVLQLSQGLFQCMYLHSFLASTVPLSLHCCFFVFFILCCLSPFTAFHSSISFLPLLPYLSNLYLLLLLSSFLFSLSLSFLSFLFFISSFR